MKVGDLVREKYTGSFCFISRVGMFDFYFLHGWPDNQVFRKDMLELISESR